MRRYLSVAGDSQRWDGFEFRDGDVVVCTPPKSGTTWTQMLVGLLIFDGPEFPEPMSMLSPWLEFDINPIEEIRERLGAQRHRRFIKTHVPLDGLPEDDRVTYLVVGRDPRDVYLSMGNHMANLDMDRHAANLMARVPAEELEQRMEAMLVADDFAGSVELPAGQCFTAAHPASVLHHLRTGWERRHRPNVALLHYRDLSLSLERELGQLAQLLGYDPSAERIAQLAVHGSLDSMRGQASQLAPDAHQGAWKSDREFFSAGRLGEWREALTLEDAARYEERADELHADADFLAWAHNGSMGGEWRR